jgi:hypothetical protein
VLLQSTHHLSSLHLKVQLCCHPSNKGLNDIFSAESSR